MAHPDAPNSLREGLKQLVTGAISEALKDQIRTTIPGRVIEFDPATQLATVQVGVQRLMVSGDTYTPPPIVRCPVCVYGASGGIVEVAIEPGDEVLIHFSMRCIDGWRREGGVAPLVSVERFREADAFAVLAPRSMPNVIDGYANDGIRIRSKDGDVYVWVKGDGTVEIEAPAGATINGAQVTSSGNVITASGTDLDAFYAEYLAHIHSGVTTGSGNTGPKV